MPLHSVILDQKRHAFEYIVAKLSEWYKSLNGIGSNQEFNARNDFSKLKVLKLHFFVCAVNAQNNDSLLGLFDNFYAMPYGHVESEILGLINENKLHRFEITQDHATVKAEFLNDKSLTESFQRTQYFAAIDSSIDSLTNENGYLVNLSALELVELSHRWSSWRIVFGHAREKEKYSGKIPTEVIKNEPKFFTLAG